MQRRARGERFFSRFSFTHPGLIRILKTAAGNLALPAQQRHLAFERLARLEGVNDAQGRPIQRTDRDRARAATLAMIARLSESPVVCTQEERRLLELLFEFPLSSGFDALMIPPPRSTTVPKMLDRDTRKDAIVIWAPLDPAWRTALAVQALEAIHVSAIVVCREGTLPNVKATFVRPHLAQSALSRARAVIDLSIHDPGEALCLARLGLPLAVQYLSGAYEMLDGVAICRSWMQRDLEMAALTALGLRPPRIVDAISRAHPRLQELPTEGPLVLCADRNATENQTYKNLISSTVHATYTASAPKNATFFSTHIALLVNALERSGADVATSDAIVKTSFEPGYALAPGAFSMRRNGTAGERMVTVPRATGMLAE
ncbi:MAG: hypothetical protein M3N19_08090 [Candidatus Eremiobacteraeota bacterium]|nr:hypothetical protein [Candidatus Eremiobacteraeota bacterium]